MENSPLLVSNRRYAVPQVQFECKALTAIPSGSFDPFDCKSTSEHNLRKTVGKSATDSGYAYVTL